MAANIAGGVDLGDTFSRLGPILTVRVLAKDERNLFDITSFSCLVRCRVFVLDEHYSAVSPLLFHVSQR